MPQPLLDSSGFSVSFSASFAGGSVLLAACFSSFGTLRIFLRTFRPSSFRPQPLPPRRRTSSWRLRNPSTAARTLRSQPRTLSKNRRRPCRTSASVAGFPRQPSSYRHSSNRKATGSFNALGIVSQLEGHHGTRQPSGAQKRGGHAALSR